MEDPPPLECAASVRRGYDRESVRDGIGLDGERQHQRVSEGGGQPRSVGTGMFSFGTLVITFR